MWYWNKNITMKGIQVWNNNLEPMNNGAHPQRRDRNVDLMKLTDIEYNVISTQPNKRAAIKFGLEFLTHINILLSNVQNATVRSKNQRAAQTHKFRASFHSTPDKKTLWAFPVFILFVPLFGSQIFSSWCLIL